MKIAISSRFRGEMKTLTNQKICEFVDETINFVFLHFNDKLSQILKLSGRLRKILIQLTSSKDGKRMK